ncbi:apolipoprotein N-acyltransferase [Dietzia sp.]|uniref:apolipoprotein N-acyltransferase n=1 Tax=Dietzia sp. TaxID=1871616 RepID=UPI002FDA6000
MAGLKRFRIRRRGTSDVTGAADTAARRTTAANGAGAEAPQGVQDIDLTIGYSGVLVLIRFVLAVAGGAGVYASFPPVGWWFLAPIGFAMFIVSLTPWDMGDPPAEGSPVERHVAHIPRVWLAGCLGIAFGLTFFGLLLPWVGMYVGWYATFGLALVCSLYTAVFAIGACLMLQVLHRSRMTTLNYVSTALFIPAFWTATEFLRSSWPWNGFPWGRLAYGQANGPLVYLAPITTTPGLSYVVALIGATIAMFVVTWQWRHVHVPSSYRAPISLATYVIVLLVVTTGMSFSPLARGYKHPDGPATITVAAVQGNVPKTGLDFSAQRYAVLENHVNETLELAKKIESGEVPKPDFVLWPENAADVSPRTNERARELMDSAVDAVGVPIVVGTVLPKKSNDPEAVSNSMLVWEPGKGETTQHDKFFVQPFGEWLPWRGLWEKLFPIAKTAGHFEPGPASWNLDVGENRIGVATCFEIAFTRAATSAVDKGARILTVPTNNATFGDSPMTYQQLAMSRVQAVEHHIPTFVAATSGVSAVIDERGYVQSEIGQDQAGYLVAQFGDMPTGTLATQLGPLVEYFLAFFGLLGSLGAMFVLHRLPTLERRRRTALESTRESRRKPKKEKNT